MMKPQTKKEEKMRKTAKKTTQATRPKATKRPKAITGTLSFTVGDNTFELELSGKVSSTGKTVVFRSSKDQYLESGCGCNIWIDLDLI
jgi:hypothetical protein